jgi:hypothetical protein
MENPMIKVFRFLAICTIVAAPATSSIARARTTYTQVDYPGAVATALLGGPNPQGTSVGSWTDTSGVVHGFSYNNGKFESFDPPGSTATTPNFITPEQVIVGEYLDATGIAHGFILANGHYETVDYPGAAGTSLDGMSPWGEIVGFYCTDSACTDFHSFSRSVTGKFTSFDPPGAAISSAAVITPFEIVGGYWTATPPTNPTLHGYVLFNRQFTTIDFPGTGNYGTFCGGANLQGDIVGQYYDSSGLIHSYLLSNGNFTSFDPPQATGGSVATGINVFDVIVGAWLDSAGKEHGYVRTP